MTIDKSGAFAVNKELEPLGQEVKTVEPPNDDQPDYSSTMYSASEAEWQCQTAVATGKDFFEQPVHCQQAAWESANLSTFSLESLLSGNTEHNPTRINAGERKPPPLKYASSVSLATTIKPSAASNGATSLTITNTPSADGCNYDAQGKPNCAVQSQGAKADPIDANSAENDKGGNAIFDFRNVPQAGRALIVKSSNSFLDEHPDCENFLNSLLGQLSKDTGLDLGKNGEGKTKNFRDFLKDFESKGILRQLTFYDAGNNNDSGAGATNNGISVQFSNKWYGLEREATFSTFFHELIHHISEMINGSSSFNDTAAARAAFNMGILNLSPEKFADLPENAQLKKDIAANKYTPEALPSKHWSGVVPTMCGAVTWKTPYIK